MKKRYRWNAKKCFTNLASVASVIVFDIMMVWAFFNIV